jgi:integrase
MTRLSGIYRYGAKYHDITDIMPKVDRPRNLEAKKKMEYWTSEEFKSMIEHVSNPTFATMFWTLYVVGCRRGEGAALTWDDIDTEKGTVTITKSITTKVKGATYKVTTPKNLSSNRTVYIPPFLCAMLEEEIFGK